MNKNDTFYKLICHFLPFTHEYTVENARDKNINQFLPKNVPVLHYSGETKDNEMYYLENNLRDNVQFITAYKGNLATNKCEFVYAYSDAYCYTVKLTYHFACKDDLLEWKLAFNA